jgi:hypothetical protein
LEDCLNLIGRYNIGIFFLAVALFSCRGNLDSKYQGPVPGPSAGENSADIARDYSENAVLEVVETNQLLNEVKDNSVSITGTGTKSTYKINYSFNSAANQSFMVIETSESKNCSAGQTKMVLKNRDGKTGVNISTKYSLIPNTEYILEVTIANSCPEMNAKFNLLAWIGSATGEPRKALVCESLHLGQTYFFDRINVMSVFTSVIGKEKFLSMDTYCGESFQLGTVTCTRKEFDLRTGAPPAGVTCSANQGVDQRSFEVSFNHDTRTAKITCTSSGVDTFTGDFQACDLLIKDYSPFKRF